MSDETQAEAGFTSTGAGDREHPMVSRRSFFRLFLGDTLCLADELRGIPQMRLQDLSKLPTEELRRVVPTINPDSRHRAHGGSILLHNRGGSEAAKVQQLDPQEQEILDLFDGQSTLAEIALSIEARTSLDPTAAWEKVRQLFLIVAGWGIYVPSAVHDRSGPQAWD